MLITISSHGGPFHFPSFEPFSMYAAFVPVPRMTPIVVSGYAYAAASIVPTVSFASAFTFRLMPRDESCVCSRSTTSWSTTPAAVNPLFHITSVPALIAVCVTGNENVNPRSPDGLPPHSLARKVAIESARKPKRPAASDVFVASEIVNFACLTAPTLPPPSSDSRSTRKLVPPRSSA